MSFWMEVRSRSKLVEPDVFVVKNPLGGRNGKGMTFRDIRLGGAHHNNPMRERVRMRSERNRRVERGGWNDDML